MNFVWRHNEFIGTLLWRHTQEKVQMPRYLLVWFISRKYTKFCILWCLPWLSSAIGRRVMVEIASSHYSGFNNEIALAWVDIRNWLIPKSSKLVIYFLKQPFLHGFDIISVGTAKK